MPAPPVPEGADDKAALRHALLAARRAIDPAQKAAWDSAIGAQLLHWWRAREAEGARVLGVYWPLRGEPDLMPAYAQLAARGVRLVLPVVLARAAPLGFAWWTPGQAMDKDAMGVAIPAVAAGAAAAGPGMAPMPDALLVPCLGFNRAGYRLGYGGGYYDRTLAVQPRPATAGVAYACQGASFDAADHDVALDVILTETPLTP